MDPKFGGSGEEENNAQLHVSGVRHWHAPWTECCGLLVTKRNGKKIVKELKSERIFRENRKGIPYFGTPYRFIVESRRQII
jgi:hypothetical protein